MIVPIVLASAVMALDMILLLPVGLTARYAGGEMTLVLRAGPVAVKRLGWRAGAKKEAGRTARRSVPDILRDTPLPLLRMGAEQVLMVWRRYKKRVRVDLVRLHITAGGADPYAAAMAYAWAGMVLEGAAALCADRAVPAELRARADFSGGPTALEAGLGLTVRLGYILGAGICFGTGLLRAYFRYRKTEG